MEKFIELREKYPNFIYRGYTFENSETSLFITFDFEIENLTNFHPTLEIIKNNNTSTDEEILENLIFNIGLIELLSYWKSTCSKNIIIEAGYLDDKQIDWLKELYFNGLGEFLYLNKINVNKDNFVEIKTTRKYKKINNISYKGKGCLIAIGGGKDSNVSLEILKNEKDNTCFIVNPKDVTLNCAYAASYSSEDIAKVYRTIDKNLIELNKQGFLNGHTPFSALLAFISFLTAYLYNKEYIVLSNENSANQSTVIGTNVNHQYSKTYEFEKAFIQYSQEYLHLPITYFSLLRPLNEYQIAYLFSKYKKYHQVFKSCNLGSKKELWEWCCSCSKCLFIFSILSPFLYKDELIEIFGEDLFNNEKLLSYFKELIGKSEHKPFECVGTIEEMNYAITKTIENMKNEDLPYLLKFYKDNYYTDKKLKNPLEEYNCNHNVPTYYEKLVKEALKNER